MTYTLPPLAYTYDALEPHIDNQTYVDKLNAAIEGSDVTDAPSEETLRDLDRAPETERATVGGNVRLQHPAGVSTPRKW
jgi:Fe-Mn family superoxide dismutase